MTDLLTPDEVRGMVWQPPIIERLCRDYLTLWGELAAERELSDKLLKQVTALAVDAAYLEKALRKITKRQGRFSLVHHEHAENTIEDMAAVAEAALKGEEWDD